MEKVEIVFFGAEEFEEISGEQASLEVVKYVLLQQSGKYILLIAPVSVQTRGKWFEIFHSDIVQNAWRKGVAQYKGILGGGKIYIRQNEIFIGERSSTYGVPQQDELDKIKYSVLEYYKKKFPEKRFDIVTVWGEKD